MPTSISALVFDCFGVLATNGWLPFVEKYLGGNPDLLQEAHDLNKQKDAGFLGYNEFLHNIAQLTGVSASTVRHNVENNVPNQKLFDFITTLKPHYKIGFLSNVGSNRLSELFTDAQIALFDSVVLSCDIGAVKPDPIMYHTICDRLEVQPQCALFIDDIPYYVTAAEQIGMHGIVYHDTDQSIKDILAVL